MSIAAERGNDVGEIVEALRTAKRVSAVCHENPDADTIGAAVAVCIIAERLGVEAEIVSADGIPPMFDFLPHVAQVVRKPHLEPGLAVFCDAATLERVGRIATEEAEWFSRATVLNIDHHISSNYFGDLNLVDPKAAATCEVLARVVDALGIEVDEELATALLVGIVRDSQGFSDGATSGDTLRAAARLVDAGAPLALIHRRILSELPFATIALWGKMLAGVQSDSGDRIVHTTLMLSMLEETGTEQHDADGLAEFLAKAKGADVTLLLRELGPEETRVSVRTSDAVDATAITSRFGGGGHVRRGGCTVRRHATEAVALVLDASRAALDGPSAAGG